MGNEFALAYFRDRAARNRLEGKSGALSDYIANDIEASERRKERFEQDCREDCAREEILGELRQQREFVEAQAQEYQHQVEAENRAFEVRKQAKLTLERKIIPDISARVEGIEARPTTDYFDLVKVWHELRAADNLYDSIDWCFIELQAPLADLRKRVKQLLTSFKDRSSPDTYLDCCEALLQAANAVSWADNFYWDINELSFSSPVDPDATLSSWQSTTEKIETYTNKMHELVRAADLAKNIGLVFYQEDQEAFQFGNVAWFQDAVATFVSTKSCSPSFKGDDGVKSLCWYLYVARSQESAGEHLDALSEKRNAKYAPLVDEVEIQAELIASLVDNPDSIESALRKRPLRFARIELVEEAPTSFLKKMHLRISNNLDARREKARAIAELARKTATYMKRSLEDHASHERKQSKRAHDREPIPDIAANDEGLAGGPSSAKESNAAQWEAITKAATDEATGREFITLLGAMYQAKRRNPAVKLTLPKMVTSLPSDQQALKQLLTVLFNIAKNDDESKLASRSQELQIARMVTSRNQEP